MMRGMANFKTERVDIFPNGTTIKVYLRSAFHLGQPGAPTGAVVAEATMTSGKAEFTGLEPGKQYVGYALVGGQDAYLLLGPEYVSGGVSVAARVAQTGEAGTELGIAIVGPPLTLKGYFVVVESNAATVHLNHRGVEVPGSASGEIKAAEATEAAPKFVAVTFAPAQWGEMVAICKGVGGSPFLNVTLQLEG